MDLADLLLPLVRNEPDGIWHIVRSVNHSSTYCKLALDRESADLKFAPSVPFFKLATSPTGVCEGCRNGMLGAVMLGAIKV